MVTDNKNLYRLLDANLNRCREGLRVIEDISRFILNDKDTSSEIKNIRHSISDYIISIDKNKLNNELLQSRDSDADVGKAINLQTEMNRDDLSAIVRANFIRAEESLRVLEEFTKLFDGDISAKVKALRYSCYSLEKNIIDKLNKEI